MPLKCDSNPQITASVEINGIGHLLYQVNFTIYIVCVIRHMRRGYLYLAILRRHTKTLRRQWRVDFSSSLKSYAT